MRVDIRAMKFIDYAAGRPDWEMRDCAIRAIAIAAERPYDEVHRVFQQLGRKDKHRTSRRILTEAMRLCWGRYQVTPESISSDKTVGQLVETHPEGRFVVRVPGHLFAMIEGVIIDCAKDRVGPRRKVTHLWKIWELYR